MNSEWQQFLEGQGARIGPDGTVSFPQAGADSDCTLFDLSHLGLIAVAGADADAFLQGQLTNDVRELSASHSQLSSHCNAKGRMLASFRLIRRGGTILLQLPRENLDGYLKRLRLFVLRSKVTLSDAGETLMRMGLAGECAGPLLAEALGEVPAADNGVTHAGELTLVRMPGSTPRFEILGPPGALAALWGRLAERATPGDADRWGLLEIRAGVPSVLAQTVEAFVPQMTNLHLVDGVSFTKGCYSGQEVVARMQYLGKLKRRMYRAEVQTDRRPEPGAELHSGVTESGPGTGRVVDARPAGAGRYELLAVVEIAAAEHGDVRLGEGGPVLRFLDLPYGLPSSENEAH